MIQISDLQSLISKWQERVGTNAHPSSYKDAIMDCIYELNSLIDRAILDEITEEEAREYFDSIDADYYSHLAQDDFYAEAI